MRSALRVLYAYLDQELPRGRFGEKLFDFVERALSFLREAAPAVLLYCTIAVERNHAGHGLEEVV